MNFDIPANAASIIIAIFAVERFMRVFFETRKTTFTVMILSYLPFVIVWLCFTVIDIFGVGDLSGWIYSNTAASVIGNVLINLPLCLIITLNYKSFILKRIVAILYICLIWDYSIAFVSNFIFIHIQPTSLISYFSASRLAGTLLFFWIAIMCRSFKHIKTDADTLPVFWRVALFLALFILSFGFLRLTDIPGLNLFHSVSLIIFGSIFLVFYLHHALSEAYNNKLESMLHSKESEYYFAQCQLMQESVEQAKSIRHDMKLHLTTIKGYVADNKKANDYLNNLLDDISEGELYSDTGNIAFDSIINYKLKNSKEDNIKTDIRLLIPTSLNIEVADIVTILGNLLDNALDAVANVEEKMIKLDIEYNRESLFIKIDNAFDGVVKYGQEKDIITRKEGSEHGHGLKNIRRSIEKYNGHIDITHEGNVFSAAIILYSA